MSEPSAADRRRTPGRREAVMSEGREERRRSTLRLPALLFGEVEEEAAAERMAVNTWIESAVEFSLEHRDLWERWRGEQKRRARAARAAERRGE